MKVKMLTRIEGTRNGKRWPEAGGVVDIGEGEAEDLIAQGYAEHVKAEPAPSRPEPEKATAKKATTRRKP